MTHQFDTEIAVKVGVNAAIIYANIEFWCLKNKANDKNFFDGNYWTYNSVKAWRELFPYLGESAIKTALKKLEDNGYIKSGNYNKSAYDRTKWYSLIHLAKIANGEDENSQPIPDNKPDNKPYIYKDEKKEYKTQSDFSLGKDTYWSKTTAEYKQAVREFIDNFIIELENKVIRNGGDRFIPAIDADDFILALESKDRKYTNFVATYRTWLRNANSKAGKQ